MRYHRNILDGLAARVDEVALELLELTEEGEQRVAGEGLHLFQGGLAQEVALMADRCAIDEELSRLESHLEQMESYLGAEGEIGKKMDFLIQEMNRETNTIGSKASDLFITQRVVSMKSEIEKMREQIQNVE